MRLTTTHQLLLCLVLSAGCAQAAATEAQQAVPDGSTVCNDASNPADAQFDDDALPAAPAALNTQRSPKPKSNSQPTVHGSAGNRNTPPRWHSFLPGMFR